MTKENIEIRLIIAEVRLRVFMIRVADSLIKALIVLLFYSIGNDCDNPYL